MENEWITWLRQRLPTAASVDVHLGDDAAVLAAANSELSSAGLESAADRTVVTTDLLTDQVHFQLGEHDARAVGYKALAVNLSDMAAMAAQPTAAFVSMALPRECAAGSNRLAGFDLAKELYEGFLPLAEEYGVVIAGGDTNSWDGPLVISVTLLGKTTESGPLLRSGAEPGDVLVVTGAFGGSILGRHLSCVPRVREARSLHTDYQLHAGLDCSDGLLLDTSRMCQESGCGAIIDLETVPVHADAERLAADRNDGVSALQHALGDGEDFELLLAVSPDSAERMLKDQPLDVPLTRIGQFVAEKGLCHIEAGQRQPLEPRGFEHG